jgi:uncharacterized membrane protein
MNLWATHHFLFEWLRHVSYNVFVANMLLILWVSTLPFVTNWVAEFPTHFITQAAFMVVQFGLTDLLLNLERTVRRADTNYHPLLTNTPAMYEHLLAHT